MTCLFDDVNVCVICCRVGPECQGEGSAEHLLHVLSSDRLSHRHTQQAPAWNSTGQLPRQRTGNTHTRTNAHTHAQCIYSLQINTENTRTLIIIKSNSLYNMLDTHAQFEVVIHKNNRVYSCVFVCVCFQLWQGMIPGGQSSSTTEE